MLFADGEMGPEVYLCANDKKQAGIVFTAVKNMIENEPSPKELAPRCEIFDSAHTKSVLVHETSGVMQAITSTPVNKDGFMPSCVIFDEIHEMRRADFFSKMTTGSGTRQQPLTIVISTAGKDLTTLGYAEYLVDKRIIDGKSKISDRCVVIYEASPQDDWTSEETWKKANPNYGVAIRPREFESKFAEALEDPEKEADFKRYFLNIWVSEASGWLKMPQWDACSDAVDLERLAKLPCWVGMDLSKRSDLTAAVCVWREELDDGPMYHVLPHFWIPEDGLDAKAHRDIAPYRTWEKAGLLTVTPGQCTDYAFVRDHILDWNAKYAVQELCFDEYNATMVAGELQEAGMTVVPIAQTHKNVAPATMELKNIVLQKRLKHGGNPMLRWNVDNVRVYSDRNGGESLSKKASRRRIDGLAALVTAMVRASVGDDTTSVYESRGVIVI